MPSMTRLIAPTRRPALLLGGFILSATLVGCHTEESHKAHHHAQGHGQVPEQLDPESRGLSEEPASEQPAPAETAVATTKAPENQTVTITLGKTEDGQTNRVEAQMPSGGSLTIQLPFQAGTGYSWALTSVSSDLKMMSQTTRSLSDDGRTGGPMLAVYVLECLSDKSVQTARFELSRPWETDTAPVRDVILLVNGGNPDSEV